jgi:DNA-binding NtrC family response regulator
MPRILVVDDDRETCRFMEELLAETGRTIETTQSPERALALAREGHFDVVVSDINLGGELSGLDVLRAYKRADPSIEVILVSGFGTLDTAIQAVRAGAFDYVSKPFDIAQVKQIVSRALRRRAEAGASPEPAVEPEAAPDELIGRSGAMLALYKQIAQATHDEAPVLVTGETGTGKELVARAIHRHGRRSARPFVPLNCGALPETLLESELFGHTRGAFTGAVSDQKGLFEQAHFGTIFLDEIGETSPAVQVRLLRAIELGEVRPVGASGVKTVDVRVIAATHRDLERAVSEGAFRQDLFYRLNVLHVRVPALRERREDIPLLARHFLRVACERRRLAASFAPAALAALAAYSWPGNVRQLENTVERLALGGAGGVIDVEDLPEALRGAEAGLESTLFTGLPSLDEIEKRYLRHVLAAVKGNRRRAADVLGIDRRTLYRMAERFGLDLDAEVDG